jgi:uncharacterized protein (TIGR02996 family)
MSEEAAFLEVLKANPADDTARLVYADWLDDHNEPAKAEYLRLVATVSQHEQNLATAPEAHRLLELATTLHEDWRTTVASRFDLIIERYADRIKAIKWIREVTGDGLGEAKKASEALPYLLHVRVPFELATVGHESSRRLAMVETSIVPSGFVPSSHDKLYNVFAYCYITAPASTSQTAEREAREALVSLLIATRGVTPEEANSLVVFRQSIVLATGLTLYEVRALRLKAGDFPSLGSNRGWFLRIGHYQADSL